MRLSAQVRHCMFHVSTQSDMKKAEWNYRNVLIQAEIQEWSQAKEEIIEDTTLFEDEVDGEEGGSGSGQDDTQVRSMFHVKHNNIIPFPCLSG